MDEFKTEDIVQIVKTIKPGLAEKQLVPGMSRFIFTGSDIATFNGGVCVHHPIETSFNCSINADEFTRIINKLTTKTIKLKEVDGHLTLTSGKVRAKFSTKADIDAVDKQIESIFNEISGLNDDAWKEMDKEFRVGVSLVIPSASKNRQKGTQCSLHVYDHWLICSDGKRLAVYELESPPDPFLVDASEISSIIKSDVDIGWYAITESWVHLQNSENVVFSIRRRSGEFPYDSLFDIIENFPTDATIKLPDEFRTAIDITSTFTEEDGKIDITINSKEMLCVGKAVTGEAAYPLDLSGYEGEEFTFPVNQSWIAEVLKNKAEMMVDKETHRVMFNDPPFTYVVSMKKR